MPDPYEAFIQQAVGAIVWAHESAPEGLTILPPEIVKVKREKTTGPNKRPATLEIVVPDKLVVQLKSEDPDNKAGIIYIVHIHADLVQFAAQRAESRLVLPGDH